MSDDQDSLTLPTGDTITYRELFARYEDILYRYRSFDLEDASERRVLAHDLAVTLFTKPRRAYEEFQQRLIPPQEVTEEDLQQIPIIDKMGKVLQFPPKETT